MRKIIILLASMALTVGAICNIHSASANAKPLNRGPLGKPTSNTPSNPGGGGAPEPALMLLLAAGSGIAGFKALRRKKL